MANYHYDEAGNMAAYFVISVLAIILVPITLSSLSALGSNKLDVGNGCQCQPCIDRRNQIRKRDQGSFLKPKIGRRAIFIALGWSSIAFLAYKAANTSNPESKVYNPFEILGLSTGVSEKEIKSHFKKLSRIYHPDKVKATANETLEDIANKFVDITKAYKSLTDETIRRNWEQYGHPDGRQEVSMGIALPKWIIEGKNNIWVLGVYGILFGGALPALVGRWWFGSRQKTKDGIHASTAAAFFRSIKETSGMNEVIGTLGKAYNWETAALSAGAHQRELEKLDEQIDSKLGQEWRDVKHLAETNGVLHGTERKALILLYAHFLRLSLPSAAMEQEQTKLLLQAPLLLNALLGISAARNWLSPTLSIMRLHAYMTQALIPGKEDNYYAQLPGFEASDAAQPEQSEGADTVETFVSTLEAKKDDRLPEVKKALQTWGRLDVVDVSFKVIGERLVTPSSIVFLLVKLRLRSPLDATSSAVPSDGGEQRKRDAANDEKDEQFLNSRKEVEDYSGNLGGWAHAPYWPGYRKPGWWLVLADDKLNRVVVPPMKISDVPLSSGNKDRDYRCYKLQFQAPPNVGLFTWKVYFVSDTLVGEEICKNISLKIDDVSALNADEQAAEDEISDPEEDSLAGQMAAMRGGAVKKGQDAGADSEDESSTDDDQDGGDSSDSD
ncbi:translocation protein sec63 [Leucogyrophana mollusca]|uniref:Translocation protein sec63 n=1 Tax=Leucogyrophana mollusca TaxID=85980 RepID=A0ACB8BWM2_9AGAM|nr:translocation protein sec63 [Leucogyrophana mollusca]